jgi:hypothetical protein
VAAEPLTPRAGRPAPKQRRGDVSPAFKAFVEGWLKRYLYDAPKGPERASAVATALDLPIETGGIVTAFGYVIDHLDNGDQELLDVVHKTILVLNDGTVVFRPPPPHEEVERQLAYAHSIWMATERGLVSRAEPTAHEAFVLASSPSDVAGAELKKAWDKAYDRGGDPSDAWDHAIKAVEAILLPIVVPKQDQAKIGQVVGELGSKGDKWDVGLLFNQTDPAITPPLRPVEALVGMLRLVYPNPDRHVGKDPREPTAEEARIVVQVATTIVQWAREGLIVRR